MRATTEGDNCKRVTYSSVLVYAEAAVATGAATDAANAHSTPNVIIFFKPFSPFFDYPFTAPIVIPFTKYF